MYETAKPKNPIHLVHIDDGIIYTFKNINEVVKRWKWITSMGSVGINHKIPMKSWELLIAQRHAREGKFYQTCHTFILRDSYGNHIDPEIIRKILVDIHNAKYGYYRNYTPGKSRWKFRYFYRFPKTTQECRWAHAWDDEEFAPRVRGKRTPANLPSAWEDRPRTNTSNHNWKKFRKHQWK